MAFATSPPLKRRSAFRFPKITSRSFAARAKFVPSKSAEIGFVDPTSLDRFLSAHTELKERRVAELSSQLRAVAERASQESTNATRDALARAIEPRAPITESADGFATNDIFPKLAAATFAIVLLFGAATKTSAGARAFADETFAHLTTLGNDLANLAAAATPEIFKTANTNSSLATSAQPNAATSTHQFQNPSATSIEPAQNATSYHTTYSKNVKSAYSEPPGSNQTSSSNATSLLPTATPSFDASAFVTQDQLNATVSALGNSLRQLIQTNSFSASAAPPIGGGSSNTIAAANAIDNLSGTTLNNVTVNGVSGLTASEIPSDIVAANYLPLSGGTLTGTLNVASLSASTTNYGILTATDASTTNFSIFNDAYFGGSATSSFDSAGGLTVAGNTTLQNATTSLLFVKSLLSAPSATIGALTATSSLAVSNTAFFFGLTSFGATGTTTINSAGAISTPSITANAASAYSASFGATATSSFDSAGNLTLAGTLTAASTTATSTFAGNLSVVGNLNFNGAFLQNGSPFIGSQWTTSGSNIYYTTGDVGIGTTSPGSLLSVQGVANFTTATSTFYGNGLNLTVGCFAIAGNCLSLGNIAGTLAVNQGGTGANTFGQGWIYSSGGSGALAASTSPTVNYITATSTTATSTFAGGAVFALGGGSVVIGTTTANHEFDVWGANNTAIGLATLDPALTVTNAGSTLGNGSSVAFQGVDTAGAEVTLGRISDISTALTAGAASGNLAFFTRNAGAQQQDLTILAAGNVGIGTTSPTNKLEVAGNTFLGGNLTATGTLSISGNTILANATSTNFFATTASSTNLFAQTASLGALSAGTLSLTGTLSAQGATFNGTTGTTTIASGQGFTIGGSQFVVQQGSGNVGIGTTSPSAKFAINTGNLLLGGSGAHYFETSNVPIIVGEDASAGYLFYGVTGTLGSANRLDIGSNGSFNVDFRTAGNIGIGTTTPDSKLSIYAASNPSLEFSLGATNGNWTEGIDTSNGNSFEIASSTALGTNPRFIINGAGNIGIGTTSPATTLSVGGNDYLTGGLGVGVENSTAGTLQTSGNATVGGALSVTGGTLGVSGTNYINVSGGNAGNKIVFNNNGPSNYMGISAYAVGSNSAMGLGYTALPGTKVTDVMTILDSGNVGIGTTTPDTNLSIYNVTRPSIEFSLGASNGNWTEGIDTSNGNSFEIASSTALGTNPRFVINGAGNVGIGTTSPATTLSVTGNGYLTGGLGVGVENTTAGTINTSGSITIGPNNTLNNSSPAQLVFGNYQNSGTTRPEFIFNGVQYNMGLGQADTGNDNNLRLGVAQNGVGASWGTFGAILFNLSIDGGLSVGTATIAPTNGLLVSGNVGIGTTSPATTLSISGNGYLTGGLGVGVENTTAGTINAWSFINTSGTSGGYKIDGNLILQASSSLTSIFAGQGAGAAESTGSSNNTAFGYDALNAATSTTRDTAVGYFALKNAANTLGTEGNYNAAFGWDALSNDSSGYSNVAVGDNTGTGITTGYDNVAIGYDLNTNGVTGYNNTAINQAMNGAAVTGHDNVGIGNTALRYLTSGTRVCTQITD
jgi:hypothetical protein